MIKLLFFKKMYLVIKICICYYADRQKEITSPCRQKPKSPNCVATKFGDFGFFIVVKYYYFGI